MIKLVQELGLLLTEELLNPYWRAVQPRNYFAGHCYVATEALYHLLGGKGKGWKPMSVKHEGGVHWFLRSDDGEILDVTADQFVTPPPYDQARGRGFLTKRPCARTRVLLRNHRSAHGPVVGTSTFAREALRTER